MSAAVGSCAVYRSLGDISTQPVAGKLRTIGYADEYKAAEQLLQLQFEGALLTVDVHLIEPFYFKRGQLLLVIGEIRHHGQQHPVLLAMSYRVLDGLDITAYLSAMQARLKAVT